MGICHSSIYQTQKIQSKNEDQIPPNQNPIQKQPDIRIDELYPINGFKRIPMNLSKSICKINTDNNIMGTGFFLNGLGGNKYLLSNNHVIGSNNSFIKIEIFDGKNFDLQLNDIQKKFYEKPKDITLIKVNDLIKKEKFQNVQFLDIDDDYKIKKNFNIYLQENVFSFGYPFGKDIECSPGKITKITDIEFEHNCDTDPGYSGSPIFLSSNSKVIGIHKLGIVNKKINAGTFLGKIDEFNEDKEEENKEEENIFEGEKGFYKIEKKVNSITVSSTGFLCHIENPDLNLSIGVFITSGNILNESDIGKEIKLKSSKKEKTIIFDRSRMLFYSKENNITFIRMKKNEFDDNDYLKIDENI